MHLKLGAYAPPSLMMGIPQTEKEPNTKELTAIRIPNIQLAAVAAPLLNSQILASTFFKA